MGFFQKLNKNENENEPKKGMNHNKKDYGEELRLFFRQPQYRGINPSQEIVFVFRNSGKHEVYLYKTNSQESLLELWTNYRTNPSKFGQLFSVKTSVESARILCNKPRGPIAGYTVCDFTDTPEENNENNEVNENGES